MLQLLLDRYLKYKKKRYINGLINKGLTIGKNVVIADTFFFDPSHCYLISIGDNCMLAPNVRLVAHDASTKIFLNFTKFGKIEIKENCFIGDSTIVLPGVTIGPNSIIGAGSIVTKTIPPNTVAVGSPAKPVCSLEEYLSRIKNLLPGDKKVFGKDYYINNLDNSKRDELLQSVQDSIGFIE